MPQAPPPPDDEQRIAVLHAYGIAPGAVDATLDGIARTASHALRVPMGTVTLLDRHVQSLPGAYGWNHGRTTTREAAFCGYTILGDEVMEVGDTHADGRFQDNPMVTDAPHLRFYAGAPVITPEGYRLGAVCGIDTRPGCLDAWQRAVLYDLAEVVIGILEGYRYQNALVAQKQQVDRFLALGQLSAGMAHEIKNALQPLVGLTGVLRETVEPDGRTDRLLATMESSALHARDIVRDVLAFARQDSGEIRVHDAPTVFGEAVTFVARLLPADVSVVREGFAAVRDDGRPRGVWLSEEGVVQVVQNLVRNAVDAMGDSGTVTVRLGRGEHTGRRETHVRPAITLTVADQAPPIDAETRKRMFDPFFTTKPVGQGTGLGLSTVLGIVHGWGGDIAVETGPNGGNAFIVQLPLAGGTESEPAA